ncbi:MAG TPA: hypothetical protein VGV61_11050 [Thermoanaerobaculia bacterium]|jgi:hypothetical protein|nr:hypothetical protein [Thermoanaerobaculia bacterium]
MKRPLAIALAAPVAALLAAAAHAAAPPCKPCVGVTTDAAHDVVTALQQAPRLAADARLYVRWRHDALADWDPAPAQAVAAAGGTPWIEVVFHTPAPLVEHASELERELAGLAAVAKNPGPVLHFEIVWEPQVASASQAEPPDRLAAYAFLLKRAAVVVTGALTEARVLTGPLPADPNALKALYAQDLAAYADGVVLQGPVGDEALAASLRALDELDPGRPVAVTGLPWTDPAELTVAEAAHLAAAGASIAFFDLPAPPPAPAAAATEAAAAPAAEPAPAPNAAPAQATVNLAPLVVLANETRGDLSFDASSSPASTWSFVRAKDLGLRVVARRPTDEPLALAFDDPTLTAPEVVSLQTGEAKTVTGASGPQGVRLRISAPVALIRLTRREAPDLSTIRGSAEVQTERQMPVEEILRRLQAFEDAQARRYDHYQAVNTTSLRFQGAGEQGVEVTFRGPFFYRQGKGFDWAWKELLINGVRWRGEKLPEIPIIQPEKAAAMPLEIHFTREYRYRLRGTDTLDGRPVWVVDFEPADAKAAAGGKLYQGTVWVDREHYGRVRTRGLQVGLTGDVISNEEVLHYTPVDAAGKPVAWTPQAFWLPLRVTGQQLLSVVNSTTVVEKETVLSELRLDGADFDQQQAQVEQSDVTMVRDTALGLRYLVKQDGNSERVVKEGFDTTKLFMLGGVFYDDALDYPLPLAGVNYFSFDVKGTGKQANVFFGGALLQASIAEPKVRGSRFDAGADAFLLAIASSDRLYRNNVKATAETVKILPANVRLHVGRPVGNFLRLGGTYELAYFHFNRTSDTGKAFTVPSSHLLHSLELEGRYSRTGYRLTAAGSWNKRSQWDPWGFAGSFDPNTRDFLRWDVRAAKSWYLPRFQRLGLEADYLDGRDLDRFSKYQFGFFGASRVHGYSSGRVRAEKAYATHASYGLGIGELLRLDLVGDAAWATDVESGLKKELLAGLGIAGSFMGPWQTVVQLDIGKAVKGPDDGFVAYLVFLKLFR